MLKDINERTSKRWARRKLDRRETGASMREVKPSLTDLASNRNSVADWNFAAMLEQIATLLARHTQATRLLRLTTPLGTEELLAECARGEETISEGYTFTISALSLDAGRGGWRCAQFPDYARAAPHAQQPWCRPESER